jgi:hypothetical protein
LISAPMEISNDMAIAGKSNMEGNELFATLTMPLTCH